MIESPYRLPILWIIFKRFVPCGPTAYRRGLRIVHQVLCDKFHSYNTKSFRIFFYTKWLISVFGSEEYVICNKKCKNVLKQRKLNIFWKNAKLIKRILFFFFFTILECNFQMFVYKLSKLVLQLVKFEVDIKA